MSKDKSSLSEGKSYQEIGEYWDEHDFGEMWDLTKPEDCKVDLKIVKQVQEKVGPPGS